MLGPVLPIRNKVCPRVNSESTDVFFKFIFTVTVYISKKIDSLG